MRHCSGLQHFHHLAELKNCPGRKENLDFERNLRLLRSSALVEVRRTSLQYHKPGIEEVGRGSHNPGLHIMFVGYPSERGSH